KRGWSSTISLTLSSSLYTSCSLAGAVLMSTNPIATPGHRAGKLLTQYNPFVAAFEPLGISVFSIRMAHIFSHVARPESTSANAFACLAPRRRNLPRTSPRCRNAGGRNRGIGPRKSPRGTRRLPPSRRRRASRGPAGFGSFHRACGPHCPAIRGDPRRRSRRAADRAQVGEVDAILPECLPVVGGKVFADK